MAVLESPSIIDITMVRGDTKNLQFTIMNATVGDTDVPTTFDLSGASITFTVRTSPSSDTVILTKSSPGDISVTDTVGGVCILSFVSADTASLTVRKYVYDLQVTSGSQVLTVAKGVFELTWDVTR